MHNWIRKKNMTFILKTMKAVLEYKIYFNSVDAVPMFLDSFHQKAINVKLLQQAHDAISLSDYRIHFRSYELEQA